MKKSTKRSNCPINYALEIFGDKWTLLIIRDLMYKNKHQYGEFLKSKEKIATNILADRLNKLEQDGILMKSAHAMNASKNIYRLTKKGIAILPILVDIIVWSSKYDKDCDEDPKLIKKAKKDRAGLIETISGQLKDELQAAI